ncbi:MAG: helix-hairpin-helix domain-containing protein [Deltaproteobacteria bacterium]
MIFERQIKGIIAICIALAVIPIAIFISGSKINYRIPEFADQFPGKIAVEIVENDKSSGIYYVVPKTSANQLLKSMGIKGQGRVDFPLNKGMKISISSASENIIVTASRIESAKLLALGMKLDINRATEDDLLLVSGIGEATAMKILDMRGKLGKFNNIEQLTEISGIKERKLAKLSKYLYVENNTK